MNWKNYLSQVLEASSLTQVQLAKELNCGQATVADILGGRTKSPGGDLALASILIGRRHGLFDPLQDPSTVVEVVNA